MHLASAPRPPSGYESRGGENVSILVYHERLLVIGVHVRRSGCGGEAGHAWVPPPSSG